VSETTLLQHWKWKKSSESETFKQMILHLCLVKLHCLQVS